MIEFIALDNQLISVGQGFLCYLEFLESPVCPIISALHHITSLSSYSMPVCTLVSYRKHIKQAIKEMLNACEIDKQQVHVILPDNIRNMKTAMDDMEVPNSSCIMHTLPH